MKTSSQANPEPTANKRRPPDPLEPREQRRGRRLAISSHPMGMTFSMVFTQHLATLGLVSLGASETAVGIQGSFIAADLLRLPTLRAVARVSKRNLLILGQLGALTAALPLLMFGSLARLSSEGSSAGVYIALASLGLIVVFSRISDTVWFPLLRSYVEPKRIGRFFGTLRSGWHLALIFYYASAQYWLSHHPGDYAPLFVAAWLCGLGRIFVIARLPERSERTGERIRIREAVALLRTNSKLRRYLLGVSWGAAVRASVVPFVLVMMRREVGFTSAQVLMTTIASFAGGLVSLYLWGRIVDRIGPAPVFRLAALGMAGLTFLLTWVAEPGDATLYGLIAFSFLHTVLWSGFGVADTHVLFGLTPPEAPTRTLVITAVVVSTCAGLAPLATGAVLEMLLESAETRLVVYHGFFAAAALLQAFSFLPLRGFRS